MNAPAISFFERLYLPPSKAYTLEEIIILIRSRRWEYLIVAYRAALSAGDQEGAREQKKQLPGFTPSGLFKGGHRANQLEAYSQIAGLDFDHVADPSGLAARLRGLATTLALFVSPGGQGLKVFVAIDTDGGEHPAAFAAVAACYEQLAGLFCDRACKDISRCCYVSYDPEAYYNPEAEVFSPSSVAPAQVFVHDWLRSHPALEGNRNQTVYRLGCEASACLPGVWGMYNKKRVYPHLFTVEVAPAANGKGCINDMRRLADRYASLIEIETKRKEEAYRQAQEEWELKKTTAHRKGKAVQIAEAPLKESTGAVHLVRPLPALPVGEDRRTGRTPLSLAPATGLHHPPVAWGLPQNCGGAVNAVKCRKPRSSISQNFTL
ncbi:BT4734/BF3469 family protein [Parabacteroides gordonii]|uniref:BT4734/BF3469 family protein n=1 Tax=Parabacteroides gordonii TaxID=574930 RepID=UPI0026F3680F|nr:BT4734/BF3469 family protein [Parabacteroides gordonii]